TLTAPVPQTVDEGASATLNLGSFADPGADGPWTVEVNWGDGGAHSVFNVTDRGTLLRQHTYSDSGPYAATVTLTDKDGGSDSKTFTITADNVAPTVAITGAPASSPEGTAITLGSTLTDPGTADRAAGFAYAWSVTKNGENYASGNSASFGFTPDDNGTYVV